MKAKGYQIDALASQIQKEYRGALIFGYDDSIVDEYAKKIARMITPNLRDEFCVSEITPSKIKENPGIIQDELNAMSLMGGRRLVWVKDVDEKQGDLVEEAINNTKTDTFLLMTGDSLGKNASIRTFCENDDRILSIVCYADEERDIRALISTALSEKGYRATPEATALLLELVGQSRAITRSEIEKLMLYQRDNKTITDDTVRRVVDDSGTYSAESLCLAITEGNHKNAMHFLDLLLAAGENPATISRILLSYFNKLLIGVDIMYRKKSVDDALKKVLTAAQFKLKPFMTRQLTLWKKDDLADIVMSLNELEKNTKSSVLPAELMLSRTITGITAKARKNLK